ncbi:MAG: family 16 glycoside hydrolase, partial [Bryobacteraceae bacterium]
MTIRLQNFILPAIAAGTLAAITLWAQHPATHHRHFGFTQPDPINFNDHAGWTSIFDGKDLKGWSGDTHYWHVENGAITVESTCEKPTGTIYLVWQGGHPANFKLKLEMKGQGANVNSGIQYRGAIQKPRPAPASRRRRPSGACPGGHPRGTPPSRASQAKWNMMGPQFDFDGRNNFTGQFYEQGTGRGIIAWRGQVVQTEQGQHPRLLATLGNPKALGGFVN